MQALLTRQQVGQIGGVIGAWLATHPSPDPPSYVLSVAESVSGWEVIADVCERMEVYWAKRLLPRWREQAKKVHSEVASSLAIRGDEVSLGNIHLGNLRYLYRSVIPQEAQARIAYETFIARFLRYLEKTAKVLSFETSESVIAIFIPEGNKEPDIPALWTCFVGEAFSADAMRETLVLLLNSVKLAERGFSVPVVPVVSEGEAEALAAFVYATALNIKRRLQGYERAIARGDKNAAQLQEKLDKQRGNYGEALAAMEALEQREPERMHRIHELAQAYTTNAVSQLKSTRAIVAKFVPYIESLLSMPQEEYLEIPPLLTKASPLPELRPPSDAADQLCYACGRVLPKPKRGAKTPVYTANKFILQAPSQTLQGSTPKGFIGQTEPTICDVCAALAVACPIKMADDALIVSMHERVTGGETTQTDSNGLDAHWLYEHHLRMFTTGELHVAAGRYLLIAAKDMGPRRKPLKEQMGGYEYALFKVASLLPADVLERFQAEAFLGTGTRVLPQRHVFALRYLIDVFDVQPWALRDDKDTYDAVADAARYVERDALNHAIYRLFEKSKRKAHYSEVDSAILERGRAAFARGLEMEGQAQTAARYNDVAGLTGVLYALVRRCDSKMRREKKDVDRRRELRKLIEDVTEGNHFTYGVADQLATLFRREESAPDMGSNGDDSTRSTLISARLPHRQQTWFMYTMAKKLLNEVNVEGEREHIDEKGQHSLQVNFDDVVAIYAHLFAERYVSVRDQRDFTYELKLSLYSRFPEIMRSGAQTREAGPPLN